MFRTWKALLGAALALASVPALATGIVPLSGSQQFDVATSPPAYLVGGRLFVYQPGTTTCAAAFTDFALTVPHPCPIVLNAAGRIPAIYAADGSVRLRLLNSTNVLQYDEDNVAIVTAASTSGGSTPIPDATQIFGTRDIKIRFDNQPLPGYVRLNGRTIGSATSGATERANVDTQPLFLQLWGFANIAVVTGKGASAAADWAANKQLTLPDMAGKMLGAMADLGNGICSVNCITGATVTGPNEAGASGGAQQSTLATPNLPPYTPSGTNTKPNITTTGNLNVLQNIAGATWQSGANGGIGVSNIQASLDNAPVFTGTAQGGTSTAFTNVPPVMLLMFHIKL